MRGPVPNLFPLTEPGATRLAIVGDCPGATDVTTGQPFMGDAGWVLDQALGRAGVARSQCFVGNVCQWRPGDNCDDFEALQWEGEEVQRGIRHLRVDLERFRPTMVLCLGDAALHLLKVGNVAPPRAGRAYRWPHPAGDWRGSLWTSDFHYTVSGVVPASAYFLPPIPLKCLATYHPRDILHQWTWQAYLKADLKRVVEEAGDPVLVLPTRVVHEMSPALNWTVECVLKVLATYQSERLPVSVDSEGTTTWVPCVGFASRVDVAHVVVFSHPDGSHVWSEDEEVAIWEAIARLLEDPEVPKVFQHYLHDAFVLAWTYGILVGGRVDDTIIQWWELNCELGKALAVQASVLTREPFWKGKANYQDRLAWVCGVDCCVTLECHQRMAGLLVEQARQQVAASAQPLPASLKHLANVSWPLNRVRTSLDHYGTYLRLLPPLLHMQLEGIPYDRKAARKELAETRQQIHRLQHKVNLAAWAGHVADAPPVAAEPAPVAGVEAPGTTASEKRKSTARPTPIERLAKFFAAVECGSVGTTKAGARPGMDPLALVTSCLCAARPRERRQVTEERWQPMRVSARGKWVKAGKLVDSLPADARCECREMLLAELADGYFWGWGSTLTWLKPAHRVVERSVEVPLVDWETAARFVPESKVEAWERARVVSQKLAALRSADTGWPVPDMIQAEALLGELSTLLDLHLNVDSTSAGSDCQWLLYHHLTVPSLWQAGKWVALPLAHTEHTREWPVVRWEARLTEAPGGRARRQLPLQINRETGRPTTNDTAILRIYQATQDERVLEVLRLRRLLTSTETLQVAPDPDGRMRCSYILPGTETARIACHTSATGSGYNLQTTTDSQRHLFRAPPGYVMAQADLRGSDAWTVAAHAAALGDPTYWDDLVAGLKPAKIITVMSEVGTVPAHYQNRVDLIELCKRVNSGHWKYYANKRVGHGASYGMGDRTTADQILTDSFKEIGTPVVVTEAYCRQVREGCFFKRYPGILRWHEAARQQVVKAGALQHSSGFLRHFHGRKTEAKGGRLVANHSTWKEWLAHEPQVSTTWATLMALLRCWEDPANRVGGDVPHDAPPLRATPIHTVHDSLLWLVREEDEEWFRGAVGRWFDNPQEVAGRVVTIPYDLQVGVDWGMA